jgi:predicted RNA-binding protein YlqC (UPF0109 family)
MAGLDFAAFKTAVETRDVDAWVGFFAQNAEWVEYRPGNPPSRPKRLVGAEAIRAYLEELAPTPAELSISHELLGERRVAYRLTVTFPDGGRIVEHVISEIDADGRVASQVDVEMRD